MAIRFECEGCGSAFSVDDRLAGRTAKCKICGRRLVVPTADHAASGAEPAFKLTPTTTAAVAAPRAVARPTSWVEAVASQVDLAPIESDEPPPPRARLGRSSGTKPGAKVAANPFDNWDEPAGATYDIAGPALKTPRVAGSSGPANFVTVAWRRHLGKIQRLFRWLNESAYLVSIPFVMMLLLGVVLKSRGLANIGAVGVVVLNAGRLAAGLANLLVIPFRDGPIQGILFLVPPFTLVYLARHWEKVRKPVKRIVEPIITVGLVVLAFSFVPWLRGEKAADASIADKLRQGAATVEESVESKLGRVGDLKGEVGDLPELGELKGRAREAVEQIKKRVQDPAAAVGGPSTDSPNP